MSSLSLVILNIRLFLFRTKEFTDKEKSSVLSSFTLFIAVVNEKSEPDLIALPALSYALRMSTLYSTLYIKSLCDIVNISFANKSGEAILINLDNKNLQISTGSACTSGSRKISHVMKQLNIADVYKESALRISFGANTEKNEIIYLLDELINIINEK